MTSCHRESYEEKIARQTTEYNETRCPQRMDQFTILDSMHYDAASRTMAYYYTIQGKMDSTGLYTSDIKNQFRQELDKNLRSSIEVKDLKDHKTTFLYIYKSESTRMELMSLRFIPKDYQ